MKVLFIYVDLIGGARGWTGHFYSGLGYLSATLKANGYTNVGLIHLVEPLSREAFQLQLDRHNPDLVGFSATSLMYPYVRQYADWVREWHSAFVICGGIHPTLCPEEVISEDSFDAVCIGEGEEALIELVAALEYARDHTHIRNLWTKHKGKIVRNSLRPLIQDLDVLPFPDRSIFLQPNTFAEQGIARVMASRGCPYRCSYCANNALARIYAGLGTYMRLRSPENIIQEIENLENSPERPRALWFDDDILPYRMDWFHEFASLYRERIHLPYECYLRPNLVTEEVVDLLETSGCSRVHMGVESGCEYLRVNYLNRPIPAAQILNAFALCQGANLQTVSLNMVGLPDENMPHALETIKLNATLNPSRTSVSIFYPIPGTDLYLRCKERGLLSNRHVANIYTQTTLQHIPLEREQIIFLKEQFAGLAFLYRQLQRGHEGMGKMLVAILDAVLCSRGFRQLLRLKEKMFRRGRTCD